MDDACSCDYDYDGGPVVYAARQHRARRTFLCYECQNAIEPSDVYERTASLYEGRWTVARTCPACLDVRKYIEAHAPCFCWRHGSLLDDAEETLRQYGHHSAGFWIGGMKRVLRAQRRVARVIG